MPLKAVQRPRFIMADGRDGNEPYVPPESKPPLQLALERKFYFLVEAMFRNPPVEHEPWEAEYYRQKFQKLIKNPKFLLGIGVFLAVLVLVCVGCCVQ